MPKLKGSQYQLQRLVNERAEELTEAVLSTSHSLLMFSDRIEWVSPLAEQNYKEYKDDFLELLLEGEELERARRKLRQFWPSRGPVWDGIGVVHCAGCKRGLVLLEAKAHTGETKSALRAKSLESREKITTRIVEVKAEIGSTSAVEVWTNQYYQMANRLCFLYFLNEQLGIPTWLVLCNFVDDASHKPTTLQAWLQHQKQLWQELGVDSDAMLMGRVVTIYPPAVT